MRAEFDQAAADVLTPSAYRIDRGSTFKKGVKFRCILVEKNMAEEEFAQLGVVRGIYCKKNYSVRQIVQQNVQQRNVLYSVRGSIR